MYNMLHAISTVCEERICHMKSISYCAIFFALLSGIAAAGKADVIDARATSTDENIYSFSVTVKHADAGWEHYADKWEVLSAGGDVLATRVLLHPHDHEQPFTRSLSGVKIPAHIQTVTIRAHDLKHGWGGKTITLDLSSTR